MPSALETYEDKKVKVVFEEKYLPNAPVSVQDMEFFYNSNYYSTAIPFWVFFEMANLRLCTGQISKPTTMEKMKIWSYIGVLHKMAKKLQNVSVPCWIQTNVFCEQVNSSSPLSYRFVLMYWNKKYTNSVWVLLWKSQFISLIFTTKLQIGVLIQSWGWGLKNPKHGQLLFHYFQQFKGKQWPSLFKHFCSEDIQQL